MIRRSKYGMRQTARISVQFGSILFSLALGLLFCRHVQATPLKSPKRMIEGRTVDLSPLFHWWAAHQGERPLTAWVHITGSVTGTNSLGWIVHGQAEAAEEKEKDKSSEHGTSHFILKNPPLAERVEFDGLRAQLNSLNADRARLLGVENNAKVREDTLSKERGVNRRYRVNETRQLRQTKSTAKEEIKSIETSLEEVKKKLAAFPDSEQYKLDCFALETSKKFGAEPVYDHGLGYK